MSVKIISFDEKQFTENPALLKQTAQLYCSIWSNDPFFGEYMKCTECQIYFSQDDVEIKGITRCTACDRGLTMAWEPDNVADMILKESKASGFVGRLLLSGDTVVGFSWGQLVPIEDILKKWGEIFRPIITQNPLSLYTFYLNELGISPEIRGGGMGKKIVKEVLKDPFIKYPSVSASLSTHEMSPAVPLYNGLGFRKLGEHPVGQGRICMGIDRVGNVRMFN